MSASSGSSNRLKIDGECLLREYEGESVLLRTPPHTEDPAPGGHGAGLGKAAPRMGAAHASQWFMHHQAGTPHRRVGVPSGSRLAAISLSLTANRCNHPSR